MTMRPSSNLERSPEDGELGTRTIALRKNLAEVEKQIESIQSSPTVEDESATLNVLARLRDVAQEAISIRMRQPLPKQIKVRHSSASALLSMGRANDAHPDTHPTSMSPKSSGELPSPLYLSRLAEDLLKHPKVFISPDILATYVHLQRLVGNPRAIPEIFHLYATKPVPKLGSSPPQFSKPNPKGAKQAVPSELADEALTAAIQAKDLPLALDVVEYTYRTPAWQRRRYLTKLGLPTAIAAAMPLVLYSIANELTVYSNYIDPNVWKWYCFAGMSTYVLVTSTLGFIALVTTNSEFRRVIFRSGTPLLTRYLREDERAAMDRIARAWGFKEQWKWGDEEGEDWEGLKHLVLLRDMVLDKSDLLPGMNPN